MQQELLAYIEAKQLQQPVLIGHSLGGFLAFALASKAPEKIGPIVSVDGLPYLAPVFTRDPATVPAQMQAQATQISYGPARKSANATPITYKDGKTLMGPNVPTAPENMVNALGSSFEFWVDHDAELNDRFNAWLAAN